MVVCKINYYYIEYHYISHLSSRAQTLGTPNKHDINPPTLYVACCCVKFLPLSFVVAS